MKKVQEVLFNAVVYRGTSIALQIAMVSAIFGLVTNWQIIFACNLLCFAFYIFYHLTAIRVRRYLKHRVRGPMITVYLSHPIRGSKVNDAEKTDCMSNSERAILAANEIRKAFPNVKIYCPGEAEKFIYYAYHYGYMTDEQILAMDCRIIDDSDCVFAYEFDTSNGMKIEINHANTGCIPVFAFKNLNDDTIKRIKGFIDELT